jgi:hypothetical protein
METEKSILQMLELLLARKEEAAARQEAAGACQEAAAALQEKRNAEAKARHERFLAFVDRLTSYGEGTTTCQTETTSSSEEMDATALEANPEATEAAVERPELFEKEETNAENIGPSEDRCEVQRLAVRRRRGAKKRPQDSVGSWQKLSAARKRVGRRAIPAVRKGNIRKGPGRNSVERVHTKSKMLDKKQRNNSECADGRVDRDLKKRLRLRMKRTSDTCYMKPTKLQMANRIVGSTNKLQDVIYWTFWKVRPPPKRKKDLRTA